MLMIVALIAAGLYSLVFIPKESAPEVEVPIVLVTTVIPGASAPQVEKLVTNEIEDVVATIADVKKITSTSRDSVSSVVIEFTDDADIDGGIEDVRTAVDRAKSQLPRDAEDPNVAQIDFVDQPIQLISISSDLPAREFSTLADDVADILESVTGVSRVVKSGIRNREVQVVVNKDKMASFGVRLTDVVSALSAANVSLPIGSITTGSVEYSITFEGDITDPREVEDVAVLTTGGEPLYVRDIAFVSDGLAQTTSFSRVSVDGAPSEQAVTLSVYKQPGGDITKTATRVREELSKLQDGGILEGSTVLFSYDTGEFVTDDLKSLSFSGLQTVLLVMVILFVAVGWREAIIAGLAIPLSFLIAFIGLYLSGNTINFVSLFSLILAIGILVDSAIVVVEGINTRLDENGNDGLMSAIATIREYHWPLTSGTMTTIVVFAALLLISGITGEFIASIPYTIIFVLTASLFVALAAVPLLASFALRRHGHSGFAGTQEKYLGRLSRWYKGMLRGLLENKKTQRRLFTFIGVAFVASISLPILGIVPAIFFPQEDVDWVTVEIEKPQGTPLFETDLTMRGVEEILYEESRIASFVSTVGGQSPFSQTGLSGSRFANVTILLEKDRTQSSTEITEDIRDALSPISTAVVRVSQPNNGPPTGSAVAIKFFGDDFDNLERATRQAEAVLGGIAGTRNVTTSLETDVVDVVFTIDRALASTVGINPLTIAQTLRTAVHGVESTTIKTNTDDIDVVVSLDLNPTFTSPDDRARATIDELRTISLETPKGTVLLGSLVDMRLERANALINHEGRERLATVSSDLAPGASLANVVREFQTKMDSVEIPDGVRMVIGGDTEEIQKTFREMAIALIVGVLSMIGILVLQFNSFRQSLYIILTVPFSLIGVLFGLAIVGKELSFPSMMGLVALAGIVVNNAIILVDVLNTLRREHPDRTLIDLVIEGSASRLRPILLTTLTTVIGVIPLTYASGLWSPLAYSIIFGLSFAVVLTLVVVPTLYFRKPGGAFNSASAYDTPRDAVDVITYPETLIAEEEEDSAEFEIETMEDEYDAFPPLLPEDNIKANTEV